MCGPVIFFRPPYPEFETDPHPALLRSIKLSLRTRELVSNSQRRYHFVSDAGTKLKYAGFNEAVPIGIDRYIFSRIGLTTCLSDP